MACPENCDCCKGACCHDNTCERMICSECEDIGGEYQGVGTKCENVECECVICQRCSHPCLSVTFADWAGESAGCDCESLNGTYILSRGIGRKPSVFVSVVSSSGSGAILRGVLLWDDATGTYSLDEVLVIASGSNYSDDAAGIVNIIDGQEGCGDDPEVELERERVVPGQPPFEIAGGNTTAASLTAVWSAVNTDPGDETWGISGVTVISGGTGYLDRQIINLATSFDQYLAFPEADPPNRFVGAISIDHAEPVLDEFQVTTSGGSGAVFTPDWTIDQATFDFLNPLGFDGRYWQIGDLGISNGGTGYAIGDVIRYTLTGNHETLVPASSPYYAATVDAVDGSGAITALVIADTQPSQFRTDGIIQYIVIDDQGEYFANSGILSVTVTNPGKIFPVSDEEGDGNACTYSLCENTNCGDGPVCRKISLVIGTENHAITVSIGGETVATGTIPAEGNSCGDMTFEPSDFTSECSSPGSVTIAAGECDGGPSDLACCTVPCSDCEDVCCMIINGRNTCEGGLVGDPDGIEDFESWGMDSGDYVGPYWIKKESGVVQVITFAEPVCRSDGKWVTYGYASGGSGFNSTIIYYPNSFPAGFPGDNDDVGAYGVKGASGCIESLEGTGVTEEVVFGAGGAPPDPFAAITFECNPLP